MRRSYNIIPRALLVFLLVLSHIFDDMTKKLKRTIGNVEAVYQIEKRRQYIIFPLSPRFPQLFTQLI